MRLAKNGGMSAPAIETENLTKEYPHGFLNLKKKTSLEGLNMQVDEGEIFGFIGPNGAGKTTAIKLLMRLIFPTAGSARILGHDISDVSMHAQIGYLPENPYFYDYLTAREFLNYCGELFGGNNIKARTQELLTRVNLDKKSWDRQLRKFSKGMLQRVGIAQSLLGNPDLLVLDEVTSGLDPVGRKELRTILKERQANGAHR